MKSSKTSLADISSAVSAGAMVISDAYAGLQSQALGLAEAAELQAQLRVLSPSGLWRRLPSRFWPNPLATVRLAAAEAPNLVIGCGGMAAAVGAALRQPGRHVVQVQNPRMALDRFDLVVVSRHDEVTGPNVIVTRTALHRATPGRLAEAAALWQPRLAHLPRPLVSVLVGGSNGRFRLGPPEARQLADALAVMMRRDKVGLALTPSRRTDPAVRALLHDALAPLGAWIWDMQEENPYFGMLALADMIIVTVDSVSMASEAVATKAPVMLAPLPGRSRRIRLFTKGLIDDGRARLFAGRFETWPVAPLDDTPDAAHTMRRRLGLD